MREVPIAEAKNTLTALIHQAEGGEPVHLTRRGKPVAVILSEAEFAKLKMAAHAYADFWQAIQEMRASPEFTPVDWAPEEIASWRDLGPDREFSWQD